jgi:uncharacterized protein (TIGR00255 family)
VHLPELLLPLERKVRALLQARSPRGHLDLKVSLEEQNGAGISVNEALIGKYVEAFQRVALQHALPPQLDVAALAQLPGVVPRSGVATTEITPALESALLRAVEEAAGRWDAMRAEEGAALQSDLLARIRAVEQAVARMEQWQREALEKAQTRLAERVRSLLGQASLDPARLAQEAVLLADRSDTSEEILRLTAHVAQFTQVLHGDADAGRKLDFLLQEMNREANTLMSKVAALGESSLPVTQAGLELKTEIEKLREQVQNLQ